MAEVLRAFWYLPGSFRLQRLLAPRNVAQVYVRRVVHAYPLGSPGSEGRSVTWAGTVETYVGWNVHFRGAYERETLGVLCDLVKPGASVVEAGANEGYHTVFMASLCGPEGRLWAFEPAVWPLERLRANVVAAGFAAVVAIHRCALGEKRGRRGFFEPAQGIENQGIGSFDLDPSVETAERTVAIETLDEVVGDRPLDLIKMDVQGAELRVLRGAARTLERSRPVILFEVTPGSSASRAARDMLLGMGYTVSRVVAQRFSPYYCLIDGWKDEWFGLCLARTDERR